MSWLLTGRRVLVREPGPDITTTIQRLLDDGAATVVVETDEPTPELRDVVGRGLAELATPGTASADVVLTDPVREPAGPRRPGGTGRVVLVGGGPGDPGLLTLAGYEALRQADVVVTDRLGPLGALTDLPADVEVVHVGKIPRCDFTPQERINAVLVERARAGQVVVRLKGGDGFVLGRGGEEWLACTDAGVPVEVIPGVSSGVAVPALAQIPVTHRGLSQGVVVVSGHVDPGDPRSEVDWAALAQSRLTLVVLMGVATLPAIAESLVAAGLDAGTPAGEHRQRRHAAPAGCPRAAVPDRRGGPRGRHRSPCGHRHRPRGRGPRDGARRGGGDCGGTSVGERCEPDPARDGGRPMTRPLLPSQTLQQPPLRAS